MTSHASLAICTVFLVFAAGCHHPPVTGADAWLRAGQAVRERADLVVAIDTAKRVVAYNLRYADTTAYRATRCEVDGGKPRFALDMTAGPTEKTNRPLDVMIAGQGFFKIKTPPERNNGEGYTRQGNLHIDKDGALVVGIGEGYKILPPIVFPKDATDVSIAADGMVSYLLAASGQKAQAGRIQLSNFLNPEGLQPSENNIYYPAERSGGATSEEPGRNGTGSVMQGYLEGSNVEVVRERLRMEFLDEWRRAVLQR